MLQMLVGSGDRAAGSGQRAANGKLKVAGY